ncbi:MAG: hypothetical protein ACE145_21125 [Terriglobia bacterium]
MRRILGAFIVILIGASLPLAAQTTLPPKQETARFGDPTTIARQLQGLFYGVVKNLDKNEMVLEKTKFGVDQPVKLSAKTKYIHDGEASTFDRLKVGDQVWLQIKKEKKTGDMTAEKVYSGVIAPTIRK